jgi:hypothetical protein
VTGSALIRRVDALLDELRAAWASGRRVSVSVAGGGRVEGEVVHVSTTGAFVDVADGRVLAGDLLAVHLPSRLGDSSVRGAGFHFDGRASVVADGQLCLPI